jgi:hypothetical protein
MIQSRTLARLLLAVGAAIMALALVVPAAGATTPNPGFEEFSACPDEPEYTTCVRTEVTGGHFQMGKKDTPITNPIIVSGGVPSNGLGFKGEMSEAKQKVPGGVVGITGLEWLTEFLTGDALNLYAVTQLAGTPSLFVEPAYLPIKVHLVNSVLGKNCYVGSTKEPIELHLTTTTTNPPPPNEPITGRNPEFVFEENGIIRGLDGEFVDNSFAAPGANGCVLTLFGFIPISINGLVNLQAGLPSPAGKNETRQEFDLSFVESSLVYP